MSSQNEPPATDRTDDESGGPAASAAGPTAEPARPTRLASLEAENERLRDAVSTAHRRRYQFTAFGFVIVGTLAIGGAVLFPTERTVLLALGGTGLFAAVLTYFLTPERFVSAAVGERIFRTLAGNEAAIVEDLALEGTPTVVPTEGSAAPARLFVSLPAETPPPKTADFSVPFLTGDAPGLALEPTGAGLYGDLTDAAGPLPNTPRGIATTVGDALVEQFELVDAVDVDADSGRVTMAIDGSAYGPADRFDHPVGSVLATTLAVELQRPVRPVVTRGERADWLVTCRFEP